jgi:hypothetical protein
MSERTFLLWRGSAKRRRRTVHEHDCKFLTRRVNNGLDLDEQYEVVTAAQVPVDAHRCSHCAPRVDPAA